MDLADSFQLPLRDRIWVELQLLLRVPSQGDPESRLRLVEERTQRLVLLLGEMGVAVPVQLEALDAPSTDPRAKLATFEQSKAEIKWCVSSILATTRERI